MKFIVVLLLCSMIGAFARPDENNSKVQLASFAEQPLSEEDGRSKRSSEDSTVETSQGANQNVTTLNDLIQLIPQILAGKVPEKTLRQILSEKNIESIINSIIPLSNKLKNVPILGGVVQLLLIIVKGVIRLVATLLSLVASIVISLLRLLGL